MHSVSNLSIHFTGEFIFDSITFNVDDRDRIGLVGKNGAGKSTLLKILAGEIEPTEGAIATPDGDSVGYLPQELKVESDTTIFKEALHAFDELKTLEHEIDKVTHDISHREDYESKSYLSQIERLNELNDRFNLRGGHNIEGDTEKVLLGLGFNPEDFDRPVKELSGGWQMRIELAKILLKRPDLLLLDEPTNHLDIVSIQWLEQFLKNYQGAVMLVSHDRAFLDNVTNRTIEITNKKIHDFNTPYSGYIKQREEIRQNQIAAFENQQKEVAQMERFIERFRYQANKASQVQSRVKKLEKMEEVEIDDKDTRHITFSFPSAPRSGKVVVEGEGVTKSFGDNLVLNGLDFIIERGDFVAFVGKNGEGKSTLSKIIVGDLDYEGEAKLGHNVKIGYYAQNQSELLDEEKTVFQTIDDEATGEMRKKVKNILGGFLFSGDELDKKVKVLSGGEKSRLALARLLLEPVNLLVLDEPTNHLDMRSKDILKHALLRYEGTLILVSHDRDFLQGLTNKVYEVKNHKIKYFLGDVNEYLEKMKLETLDHLDMQEKAIPDKEKQDKKERKGKQEYRQRKERDKQIRKIKKQIEQSESRIEELEGEIEKMDKILANPEKNAEKINSEGLYEKYEAKKKELSEVMEEWERLHEQTGDSTQI